MDQPKIERLLRLMKMMSGSVNYSIDELSDKLDMSPRTIYRYIDTFKNAGFAVTKDVRQHLPSWQDAKERPGP